MNPELLPLHIVLARLCLSFLIGALIGLERERQHRPAGLRTHILVALASALFAMISIVAAGDDNDPGRIAAQVVTGIGFLGAGTIMRHGSTVKGLTTAASLWTAAALGLAAGFGWTLGAVAAALLAFIVLVAVKAMEDWMARGHDRLQFVVTARPGKNPLSATMEALTALGAELHEVKIGPEALGEGLHFTLTVSPPATCNADTLARALHNAEGVREVERAS
jgi:putative Mg2+ transporter-C (MgtC) family protein